MTSFHAGAVLVDTFITAGMWSMFSPKNYFVTRTRIVLEKLIMYSVARGLLLTLAQTVHLISMVVKPMDPSPWFPSQLVLSNLCVSTLLAILNARTAFRETMNDDPAPTFSLRFATSNPTLVSRSQARTQERTGVAAIA
ncbi:hypothetical protein BD779DRAFT_1542223 [Infundibulicybe gibba]|nr:hypothetical protein BD779DRAFT_1542223 [Infundibulicybe gibba]